MAECAGEGSNSTSVALVSEDTLAYVRASILFFMSRYIWSSNHILEAQACFLVSLCLLFASVGQASARPIASLP